MRATPPPAHHALVTEHTIYSCVMGSRAFGLATEASDTDRRGVFVAPTPLFWGFDKPPTHVEGPEEERFSWELERFCELALRANPNALEILHSPLVEHVDATGRELLELRGAFLSRRAHQSHVGYARAQYRRFRQEAPRWKHVMHMLRLLTSCRDLLRTGVLTPDVGEGREGLLAVRRGEVPWVRVEAWAARLFEECEEALRGTPLPEEPDTARVEDFLVRVRRTGAVPRAQAPDGRCALSSSAGPAESPSGA